jgi:hypothetical protein
MIKYITYLIAKARIPKGDYCYKIKKIAPDPKYGYVTHTKPCPYYSYVKKWEGIFEDYDRIAYCKYRNEIDYVLLDDQCKICGINND